MNQLLMLEMSYPSRSGNNSTRPGGSHYLVAEAGEYREAIQRLADRCRAGVGLSGPLEARWVLSPPDDKARDQTNVLKVCEDALVRAGVLKDDSNKVIRRTVVEWVEKSPGGAIIFEALEYGSKGATNGTT